MGKIRKNFVTKPKDETDEEDSGQVNDDSEYDSMIENGNGESDSDEGNEEIDESDDGFSDKEPEDEVKINEKTKRKLPPINETGSAKKTRTDKHLYKPPTVEEMNQLRETENLYHSNLFRLQIQEMLNEIKIKEKYTNFIKTWLDELNDFLENLESMPEKEDANKMNWLKKSGLKIPLILDGLETKTLQFQFFKPSQKAFLIGSAMIGTMIGPELIADICVLMPAKSFQKDNYLNLAYDQKRALYLTYLASRMTKTELNCAEMRFNYFRNNPHKPVLEIAPSGSVGRKLLFRIFVSGEPDSFKMSRFVPWNSNIRGSLFGENSGNHDEEICYATPSYNANVLLDLTMRRNRDFIEETIGTRKNLQEGLILLKIWLKQRNIDAGLHGFGPYIMTMFVIYLFREKKLHASMSSYQIARNVWNHLG